MKQHLTDNVSGAELRVEVSDRWYDMSITFGPDADVERVRTWANVWGYTIEDDHEEDVKWNEETGLYTVPVAPIAWMPW